MNRPLRELRVRNKGFAATRRAAKSELDKYKRRQRAQEKDVSDSVIRLYRTVAREDARYCHVAYSLLKGNKYSEIERSCSEPLDPKKLLAVIKQHDFSYDLDKVKALLSE